MATIRWESGPGALVVQMNPEDKAAHAVLRTALTSVPGTKVEGRRNDTVWLRPTSSNILALIATDFAWEGQAAVHALKALLPTLQRTICSDHTGLTAFSLVPRPIDHPNPPPPPPPPSPGDEPPQEETGEPQPETE